MRCDISERTVATIPVQAVRSAIGDVEVEVAVGIEVDECCPHSKPVRIGHACLRGDVLKCPVTAVPVEAVAIGGVCGIAHDARMVDDVEVGPAVRIVVAPREAGTIVLGQRASPLRATVPHRDPGLGGDIGEAHRRGDRACLLERVLGHADTSIGEVGAAPCLQPPDRESEGERACRSDQSGADEPALPGRQVLAFRARHHGLAVGKAARSAGPASGISRMAESFVIVG